MNSNTEYMSKTIEVSDEVYRKLLREKGDRSFSEVIDEHLEAGQKLADVTGNRVLDESTSTEVRETVERMSEGTLSGIDDETL